MNFEEISLKKIDYTNTFFDKYRNAYNGFDNWFQTEQVYDEDCLVLWDRRSKTINAILYASIIYQDEFVLDDGNRFILESHLSETSKALKIEMFSATSVTTYISMFMNFLPRIKIYQDTDIIYMIDKLKDEKMQSAISYVGLKKIGTISESDVWMWSRFSIDI